MITAAQKRVLDCIRDHIARHGFPPTLREIGNELGIRSTNGVADHIYRLEREGYIRSDHMKSRGLILVDKQDGWPMIVKTGSGVELHRIRIKAA